jgi:tetratricopeptide (TPR) repeat protein
VNSDHLRRRLAAREGRFEEAARYYARLAPARLNRSERATLHRNLAALANAEYRFTDGEEHARQALQLRRADRRVTPVVVARDVAVLAAAVAGQHRHDEARYLFWQALAALRAAQPAHDDEVAALLYDLGGIEHDGGNLAAAEWLYREALGIKLRLLGPAHPAVAVPMSNLAILLRDLGCKDEAAAYFGLALAISEAG